jgi:cytochrome P450
MNPAAAAELDELLTSSALLENPYPIYSELRARAPVYRSEARGEVLISGYDEVMTALHATEDFSNYGWELARFLRLPKEVQEACPTLERTMRTPVLVFSDPPLHTRLRKLVNRSFTPRGMESSRGWIGDLCAELFDEMGEAPSVDFVSALAQPLPIRSIVGLFGGRPEDVTLYKDVSFARLLFQGTPIPDAEVASRLDSLLAEYRAYLEQLWARLRDEPDAGLLSSLVLADESGDRLSDDELFHACVVFLSAGHETTTSLLGNMILALLRYPDQFELLRADRTLIRPAVEEALRWITPVQRIHRIAARDVEFGGQLIRKGELVVLLLAAANRDPERFPDPDRFRVDRPSGSNVAFGHGIHFCVGAGLARMEASFALETLLERADGISGDEASARYARSINIRALETLPVDVSWIDGKR